MMWFVYIDNEYVGTVIAATEPEALSYAREKFASVFEYCTIDVRRRLR